MTIRLREVSKHYQRDSETVRALSGIDLTIASGEFVAITGPSGSGKTTLANLLSGLDSPTQGTVQAGSTNLAAASDAALSRYRNQEVGFIFQSFNLLVHLNGLENVRLPLLLRGYSPAAATTEAAAAIRAVGLWERRLHRPGQLSGGQQQRLAVARAVVGRPNLIIADEPTGNLDTASGRLVLKLLCDLHRAGKALVIITHDQAVANLAERIVTIVDGEIAS